VLVPFVTHGIEQRDDRGRQEGRATAEPMQFQAAKEQKGQYGVSGHVQAFFQNQVCQAVGQAGKIRLIGEPENCGHPDERRRPAMSVLAYSRQFYSLFGIYYIRCWAANEMPND